MGAPALDENLIADSAHMSFSHQDAPHQNAKYQSAGYKNPEPQASNEDNSHPVFPSLTADRAERIVTSWLDSLLQRFSVQQLDVISESALSSLLSHCQGTRLADLRDSSLLTELKRRIMRLSGAQLGKAFVSMSPDIVDETDVELIFLEVEGRRLQGIRYQGEVYRLMEAFVPSYRLQAYCLGQTLCEQTISYLITRSTERFAVWVNAKALPQRSLSI